MSFAGPHGVRLSKAYNNSTTVGGLKHTVGQVVSLSDGDYLFCKASGAILAGDLCKIDPETFLADSCTTAESGSTGKMLGVAQAALADAEYGWFWRGNGETEALVADGIAADTNGTTTATAGVIGSGGDAIVSLTVVDANSSGAAALRTVKAYGLIGTN